MQISEDFSTEFTFFVFISSHFKHNFPTQESFSLHRAVKRDKKEIIKTFCDKKKGGFDCDTDQRTSDLRFEGGCVNYRQTNTHRDKISSTSLLNVN